MLRVVLILVVVSQSFAPANGQDFRPRNQSPSAGYQPGPRPQNSSSNFQSSGSKNQPRVGLSTEKATQGTAVSGDLTQLYSQTSTAKSEADFTRIAKAAAKAVADSKRSKTDRDYAASLLAWSLNRRGELRSEQAGQLAASDQLAQAKELDSQATEDFATAVEYAPNNWRHRHNYSISLALGGDYKRAIQQLDQAIQLNPKYANAYFNRAELYFELAQYESAEKDYSRAIDIKPDAQYYNCRAHSRFLREAYEVALSDYRQAAQEASDNAAYHTDLGDACQYLGRWEEAANAYRAAVAADNTHARAYQNAAWLMATCPDERLRNQQLAISAAKKALELTGAKTAETLETMAAATAALGKHSEAAKLQDEAVQLGIKQRLNESQLVELKQRLALYRSGQAYLQPQPTTATAAASSKVSR
jgi:tetratricopeptide (TPR) repeat protein